MEHPSRQSESREALWELFPGGEHLHPLLRSVYYMFVTVGVLAISLVLFCVVLELLTTTTATTWTIRLGVASALVSVIHVILESRSTRPISWGRWLCFLVAQAVFGYELWITIQDSIARVLFSSVLLLGITLLFAARWVVTHNARAAAADQPAPEQSSR